MPARPFKPFSPLRSARELPEVQRHSYLVGLSRRLLWSVLGLIALLLIYFSWGDSGEGVRVVFSKSGRMEDSAPNMINPRYQGLDSQNRPFTITADIATQVDSEHVTLKNLNADMTVKDSAWLALSAKDGHLALKTKQLELARDIYMFYEGGYEMRAQKAHVDMQKGEVQGQSAVEGQGPPGLLSADNFAIYDEGKRLVFTGHVKLTIYQ